MNSEETDARHRRRKKVKALKEGIEASERAVVEKVAAAAKAQCLATQQTRAARRLVGLPYFSSSSNGNS